jgi:hypothetical protein
MACINDLHSRIQILASMDYLLNRFSQNATNNEPPESNYKPDIGEYLGHLKYVSINKN